MNFDRYKRIRDIGISQEGSKIILKESMIFSQNYWSNAIDASLYDKFPNSIIITQGIND